MFRTSGSKETPNCYLSDILQRDLLSDVDYVADRASWLFAWDNYNPECMALATGEYPESGNAIGSQRLQESSRGSGRVLGAYSIFFIIPSPQIESSSNLLIIIKQYLNYCDTND